MTNVRADIPEKYKWELSEIYPTKQALEDDIKKAEQMIELFRSHQPTILNSAAELLSAIEDYYAIMRLIEKMYSYASNAFNTDTSVNSAQALSSRMLDLYRRAAAAAYFFTPALTSLDSERLEAFYAESPGLAKYRRSIDVVQRCKPHTLSDECEKLLAEVQTGIGGHDEIYSILTDCDMTFGSIRGSDGKPVTLNDSSFIPLVSCPDRSVRRAAFNKLYSGYEKFGNTIATIINSFIKEQVTLAHVRNFSSAIEASTFNDEVTTDIYSNLITTVNKNLSVLFDYYDVKREMLGLPRLHLYDVYTPLVSEFDKNYTYEEAVDEVLDTVKIFGPEYHDTLKKGLCEQRWVDVYPNDHKRGGAYSGGSYDTAPYILLNFNGRYDDVSTLAHEAGHSMHSYMSRAYNEYHASDYKIFVAEVASTVNELLLAHKKLRESESDAEKLSVLNNIMETFKGALFRQTMFAEFERELYFSVESGIPLTKEYICEKYYKTVKRYFGPRVVCDKKIANEWMRIPHFYYNFYVYKYATCISAAASIVKRIEDNGESYISKYLDFLKCGDSLSPVESLKIAGIDMTDPGVIEDAIAVFADTVKQFRAIACK